MLKQRGVVAQMSYHSSVGLFANHLNEIRTFRFWKCDIKGASEGILKGKTVAIKDNICVAGVPLINGSSLLEGYTPDVDATVVTRILDVGKR